MAFKVTIRVYLSTYFGLDKNKWLNDMLNSLGRGNWFQKPGLKTGMANGFCWVRLWRTGGTPSPVISKIILTRGGLVRW